MKNQMKNKLSGKISLVEVGPRDGLQNEPTPFSVENRVTLVRRLADAGLRRIEAGAFVSAKKIPQMASSGDVLAALNRGGSGGLRYSVLVPNARGMEDALAAGAREVAVFTAASESFTKKNIDCTIDESFERFGDVMKLARRNKIKVRAYVSTCFGCPYEGKVDPRKVAEVCLRLVKLGVYEVSVGDTIGVANPTQVKDLLKLLFKKIPKSKLAMHFHDTRGTALANIYASLEAGIRTFDSSVGGLGGCPYAPGASGNVATEDVVYMLEGMGLKTGVNLAKLLELNTWIASVLGRPLPSKVGQAGLGPRLR
jgi:hydroxymethylglutaryl-CoA lyase